MAKKTKDSNLSLEERLEQALIPNWNEPYKLPENWCWVYLTKGFAQCLDSFRKPVNASERSELQGDIPYYGATGQVGWINDYLTNEHLVLLGEDGAPFLDYEKNKAYIIKGKAWVNNHAHILKSFYGEDSNLYLMHYLNVFNYHGYVNGSTRLKLTQESMNSIPVPLAPIDEQQRIVSRIQSLFAKLDEAKEKAQEVVDGFETRKAAILHKAFSGELTAKWREENGVSKNAWTTRKINQVCNPRAGYAFDSKKFTNAGYQIIRMGNLYGGILDLSRNPVFTSAADIDDAILKRSLVNDGDILITLTGTKYKRDYGYAVCIRNPHNLLVNQRILCLSPKLNEITTDYLLYYLQSDIFRDVFFSNETGGVNQGNVSSKFVENIQFDVPSYREQEEIGYILRSILEKQYQAKEVAETVITQIDSMKKAILASAFRGKLGTNDPTEESAKALIKQLLEERIKAEELESKRTPKKRKEVLIVVKTIMETLKSAEKLTPEKLKAETGLEIDDFYDQLKVLIDSGQIREIRIDGESYLEAAK